MQDANKKIMSEEIKKINILKDVLSTASSKLFDDYSREPLEIAGTIHILHSIFESTVKILTLTESKDGDDRISAKEPLGQYMMNKELIGNDAADWFDRLDVLHAASFVSEKDDDDDRYFSGSIFSVRVRDIYDLAGDSFMMISELESALTASEDLCSDDNKI